MHNLKIMLLFSLHLWITEINLPVTQMNLVAIGVLLKRISNGLFKVNSILLSLKWVSKAFLPLYRLSKL